MNLHHALVKSVASVLAVLLITVTCVSFSGSTVAEDSDVSIYWLTLARNAWNYFQPGAGVCAETGIAGADIGHPYLTDWDLAFYLQAIMDAQKIGIINRSGPWGADDRINKVLKFLEERTLMPNGLPYIWYSAITFQNSANQEQVATDTGKLLVALKNLEAYDSTLKGRIENIVYNRTNYEPRKISIDAVFHELKAGIRPANAYDYYVTRGFACFWPERFTAKAEGILDYIVSADKVNYSGVLLPKAKILCDPLFMCILEFEQNDKRLIDLTTQVYLAHEARYNITGHYTACSEGSTGLDGVPFVYEWVVMNDGRMWVSEIVYQDDTIIEVSIPHIIYLKAAVGLLAIYNTPFARNMVNYLVANLPYPVSGYNQGIDENGRVITYNNMGVSNGMIITEARYALENSVVVPGPLPSPSPPLPSPPVNQNPDTQTTTQATFATTPTPAPKKINTVLPDALPELPTPTPRQTASIPMPTNSSTNRATNFSNIPTEYYVVVALAIAFTTVIVTIIISKRRNREGTDDLFGQEIDWAG